MLYWVSLRPSNEYWQTLGRNHTSLYIRSSYSTMGWFGARLGPCELRQHCAAGAASIAGLRCKAHSTMQTSGFLI